MVVFRNDHGTPSTADDSWDVRQVWVQFDLTAGNLGNYEPIIDNELWDSKRQLHFLYQPSEGLGYISPNNLAAGISVLEWDAAAYFAGPSQPGLGSAQNGADAVLTMPSEPSYFYRLWSTTDFIDWQIVDTQVGTGSPLIFTHVNGRVGPQRFWRFEAAEGGFP